MAGHTDRLSRALAEVLPALADHCRSPWWLIGSSALAIWSVPEIECADIDVLLSVEDAERLARHWASHRDDDHRTENDHLFRSRFARYTGFAVPVETMADLELHTADGWRPVVPSDRRRIATPQGDACLPSLDAMIAILTAFGRDKDLRKADQVRAWLADAPRLPTSSPA